MLSELNLSPGQIRVKDHIHNGGWYDKTGKKIGWGDLSCEDIDFIATNIPEGELLIVLTEEASFWAFVTETEMLGSLCKIDPMSETPGFEYLAKHARYVISRNIISVPCRAERFAVEDIGEYYCELGKNFKSACVAITRTDLLIILAEVNRA